MTTSSPSSSLSTSNTAGVSNSSFLFSSSSFSKPPIFLLKTKSTPTDGYDEYFRNNTAIPNTLRNGNGSGSGSSSGFIGSDGYEPIFVPVLEHRFNRENLRVLREYFLPTSEGGGAFLDNGGGEGQKGRKYGGIIFTSQRAVEGFAKLLVDEVGVPAASAASHSLILYSVGPATSRALRAIQESHLPHAQIYGDEAGTGEKLAHMILEHYNGLYKNTTTTTATKIPTSSNDGPDQKPALLFLVGEQRRDIIPKTLMSESLSAQERIQVDELVLYETGEMASFESEFRGAVEAGERFLERGRGRQQQQQQGSSDHNRGDDEKYPTEEDEGISEVMWTVIFSPTGCDAMLRTLNLSEPSSSSSSSPPPPDNNTNNRIKNRRRRRRRNCFIATIGPTTRDHLRSKYGIEPDVCAEKPSPEGVGRGIEAFMRARRGANNK